MGIYSAVILAPDRYWLAKRNNLGVSMHHGTPNLAELRSVLDNAAALFDTEGTILVDAPVLAEYAKQAQRGAIGEWHGPKTGISAWTTYTHRDANNKRIRPDVHLGVLPAIEATRSKLFDLDEDRGTIAERLGWYHAAIGSCWRMSAGVAGCSALKELYTGKGAYQQPFWGAGMRRQLGGPMAAGDLLWSRDLTDAELAGKLVHAFDLNAARLSAANVADLPWTKLQETGPAAFDPDRAGYWQVGARSLLGAVDKWWHRRGRPLLPPWFSVARVVGGTEHGDVWLSTPILKQLVSIGVKPEILATRTADSKRWALSWAKTVDRARLSAYQRWGRDSHQFRAVAATYAQTWGLIDSEGGSIFLPVASHQVYDRQRVTLLRHADRAHQSTGRAPFRVHTDCLWYVSDKGWDETAETLFGADKIDPIALGKFKPKGTWSLDEWLSTKGRTR